MQILLAKSGFRSKSALHLKACKHLITTVIITTMSNNAKFDYGDQVQVKG